jgi:molybdopterin molybdotransferase
MDLIFARGLRSSSGRRQRTEGRKLRQKGIRNQKSEIRNTELSMDIIPFEEAYRIVLGTSFETGTETVPFTDSLNRVLRTAITSDMDMPPFNKATVDGFACRRTDLGTDLELIETIPAGSAPEREVCENQCSRIMTGAAVPVSADMVFMVEDSVILPSGKVRCATQSSKDNISPRGEDVRSGDIMLEKGRLIRPQDIAMMALTGNTLVSVSRQPLVAVISSGNELVEPFEKPGLSQIRNTNSYQLMAQIMRAGAKGKYCGIARDDPDSTLDMINQAISGSDVVIISGGVSMGDFDFVPSVLEKAGVKILFSRINIQPGKPTVFGIHQKARVFGLPGNPVSSFVQFELLVRPLLCRMMGYQWDPEIFELPMERSFSRKSADKRAMIPVVISGDRQVSTVEYHGSAHISAFSVASGIITLPEGKKSVEKGEIVSVRQI